MQKIKKGDTVQILLGKDRGKSGKVDKVLVKEAKLLVEGVNMFRKHVRKYKDMEGGIVDIRKPIDLSNAELVCPSCKKPTRVGFKQEADTKIRVCKKCGKEIK